MIRSRILLGSWAILFVSALACAALVVDGVLRDTRYGEPVQRLELSADTDWLATPFRVWGAGRHRLILSSVNHDDGLVGRSFDGEIEIRVVDSDGRVVLQRAYGLKVGEVSRGRFEARIRDLIEGHDMLATVIGAMLHARAVLWNEFTRLHRAMLKIARADPVCQRLMSAPGVGALVALTYRSAVDDPGRFAKSRTVGEYFGLTTKKYQSGETDIDGGISKVGECCESFGKSRALD